MLRQRDRQSTSCVQAYAQRLRNLRQCGKLQDSMHSTNLHAGYISASHFGAGVYRISPAAKRYSDSVRPQRLLRHLAGVKLGLLILLMGNVEGVTPVPAGLTELNTVDGQRMLRNSTPSDRFWQLAQEFVTQDSQDWCGLASASMVLNALPIPKPALHDFQGWVSLSARLATKSNLPATVQPQQVARHLLY